MRVPASSLRRTLCLGALLCLAACAVVPPHDPVPETAVTQSAVPGFPADIRFWSDEAPAALHEMVRQRIDAYRATQAGYYRQHGRYPDLHYLAISGGAYDGAFGAGLLSGWSDSGTRPDFAIVTGVSTGALIAPFVFIGPQYDPMLRELYTKTHPDNIFITDIWKIIGGVTGGLSVTDSAPLAQKISDAITPRIMQEVAAEHRKGKRLFIGTTNIEAQRGVIWDIGAIANSGHPDALRLIHQVMLASASVPGLFAPVFIDVEAGGAHYNEIHADGGITSQVFVYPLKLPKRVVDEFRNARLTRHLYIVRNSKITPEYQPLSPGLFSLTRRSIETLIKYQGIGDLYRLYLGAQRDGIDYNLITIPQAFKVEPKELFDPAYMSALFDTGYAMGKDPHIWLKKPPGVDYINNTP